MSDLLSSLFVNKTNRMTGKVAIAKPGGNELPSILTIPYKAPFDLPSTLDVPFKEMSDLPGSIGISPWNRMAGIVEVVPPPTYVKELTPVKDAFVRANVPRLNYGSEEDLFVGISSTGEEYRSFLQFDLSSIPVNKKITSAKVKLYNTVGHPDPLSLCLYEIGGPWTETSITWNNQPINSDLIDIVSIGSNTGYIEFDVLKLVEEWFNKTKVNNGISLSSLNQNPTFKRFFSRENKDSHPKLEVTYIDNAIPSFGRSDISGQVTSRIKLSNDIKSSLIVQGYLENSSLPSSLQVKNSDTLLGTIEINQREIPGNVIVKVNNDTDLKTSVDIRNRMTEEISGDVFINQPEIPGKIDVRYRGDASLPSSVTTRAPKQESLIGELFVSKPDLISSLTVGTASVINSDITVRELSTNTLPSVLTVRNKSYRDLLGHITVFKTFDIPSSLDVSSGYIKGSITVSAQGNSDLQGTLDVYQKSDLSSSITPRVIRSNDISSTLYVSQIGASDLPSSINVIQNTDINGSIKIRVPDQTQIPGIVYVGRTVDGDLNSSINVFQTDDLNSSINPRISLSNDLQSSINVFVTADLQSSIFVRNSANDDLSSTIKVRKEQAQDIKSSITVRQRFASDIESSIQVPGTNGAYAFIM